MFRSRRGLVDFSLKIGQLNQLAMTGFGTLCVDSTDPFATRPCLSIQLTLSQNTREVIRGDQPDRGDAGESNGGRARLLRRLLFTHLAAPQRP